MSLIDANAASHPDSGVFGLSCDETQSRVILLPVAFDATTSYRRGAAHGPSRILKASHQVDLLDIEVGRPYEAGITMLESPAQVEPLNLEASTLAQEVRGSTHVQAQSAEISAKLSRVNEIGSELNNLVLQETTKWLQLDKTVGIVGGDHSVSFGSIRAHAQHYPGLGILHIDAHADLRKAYEGFRWSHASILYNVMNEIDGVARLVQVGVRDFCEEEQEFATSDSRIRTWYDAELAAARFMGTLWGTQVEAILEDLPRDVYVTFDIDGLDPSLCPNTGTPVPGGLSFNQATFILKRLVESGRRLVGFDLVEVSPGNDNNDWDANVGARMLYKLIGWSLRSR